MRFINVLTRLRPTLMPGPVHLIAQHACAHEWTLQMQLVQAAHQLQVGFRNKPGAVIEAAATDADQFSLSCQR
jgi:hypothetical protein